MALEEKTVLRRIEIIYDDDGLAMPFFHVVFHTNIIRDGVSIATSTHRETMAVAKRVTMGSDAERATIDAHRVAAKRAGVSEV
jgi:hypothetical protein